MSFAVIGHSFIRRIQWHELLTIEEAYVHTVGIGSSSINTIKKSEEFQQTMLYQPNRVFIQIGGNDIKTHTTAFEVFDNIRSYANTLTDDYGVEKVVIGSLFRKFKPSDISYDE